VPRLLIESLIAVEVRPATTTAVVLLQRKSCFIYGYSPDLEQEMYLANRHPLRLLLIEYSGKLHLIVMTDAAAAAAIYDGDVTCSCRFCLMTH